MERLDTEHEIWRMGLEERISSGRILFQEGSTGYGYWTHIYFLLNSFISSEQNRTEQNMGFCNLNSTTLNLKLVTFCTVKVFNMLYVQPFSWQCFLANSRFKNRYRFMCFTVQTSHNPRTANNMHATKNSRVRSAILLSASLKISLCPKYSQWSPCIHHCPGILQLDFSHRLSRYALC